MVERHVLESDTKFVGASAYVALLTEARALAEALGHIERAYATHGERMAHQDYAKKHAERFRAFLRENGLEE